MWLPFLEPQFPPCCFRVSRTDVTLARSVRGKQALLSPALGRAQQTSPSGGILVSCPCSHPCPYLWVVAYPKSHSPTQTELQAPALAEALQGPRPEPMTSGVRGKTVACKVCLAPSQDPSCHGGRAEGPIAQRW
jgi:hypothetical protein